MKIRWSGSLRLAILAAASCAVFSSAPCSILQAEESEAALARFFARNDSPAPATEAEVETASWNGELAPVVKAKGGNDKAESNAAPRDHVIEFEAAPVIKNRPDAALQATENRPLERTSPPFDPIQPASQIQNHQRESLDANRLSLDAQRSWIDGQPGADDHGHPSATHPQPRKQDDGALSNYYGQVTVNYFVGPEGQHRGISPAHFQEGAAAEGDGMEVLPPGEPEFPGFVPDAALVGPHDASCSTCGKGKCAPRRHKPSLGVFADGLYLRPGNMDVVYATEQNGCDPLTSTPTGPQGIASPDVEAGFRAGLVFPVSDCASIIASYTWFQSDTNSTIQAAPGTVVASQVTHPNVATCGDNSTTASAKFDIDFQFVDLDYHHVLISGCNWGIGCTAGVRYGRLSQEFEASQDTGVATGLTTVTTDIDFDGVGVRMGLDGECHSIHSGLFLYSRGTANFLGGQTQARYLQVNQFDPSANIALDYEDYRLTTILEGELGAGWQSPKGHVRTSVGFQANAWHNTLLTQAFIDGTTAPETNDDFATFSGLVGRIELRR